MAGSPVSTFHRGGQKGWPQPKASKAMTLPSSAPVNTAPPATAGWIPKDPAPAAHLRAPVAASSTTSPLVVGTNNDPCASAGVSVTWPGAALLDVQRMAPVAASRA